MRLNIPYYEQDKNYTCGPVALQMVLKFLGDFESEGALAKKAGANEESGTTHKSMLEAAKLAGYYCRSFSNSSLDELKKIICSGLPVIVNFVEPSHDQGHYAVVVGFERGSIVLNDPWNGEGVKINEKEFMSRWHNEKNTSRGWMLVISNEKLEQV